MTTFCDLGVSEALAGVLADKNIKEPTPIQQQAIPKILAGTDILGVAPDGHGQDARLPAAHPHAARQGPPRDTGRRAGPDV